MRILFDHGTPAPLRRHLPGHSVDTASERGWASLRNGNLLDEAEADGYHLLITTNQNMRYQQNFSNRSMAVMVLMAASWPKTQPNIDAIRTAVDEMLPGEFREISV